MVAALRDDPERASHIVGLIDHHAIAESYSTKGPTFLDVRPWGSMASIVAHSYIRDGKTLEVPYARILLCAILSDTLALRSPTTTQADRLMVALLEVMGGVDEVRPAKLTVPYPHSSLDTNLYRVFGSR
jgi:manganese-dependent inorganic pyrophosphatase